MEKYHVDFTKIAKMLDSNRIPLKGNEHRLVKVAFDMFRIDGDESDDLWQLQADDDGNEFLVRTYSLDEDKVEASNWSVMADKKYANLTISFNNVPLIRLASKDFGAETPYDGKSLQGVVYKKLSSDGKFALKLLSELPSEKFVAIKQSGLLEDIKNWITAKDITDPIIEEIKEIVDKNDSEIEETEDEQEAVDLKKEPAVPFGNLANNDKEWSLAFFNLHLNKEAHCGKCGINDVKDMFGDEYDSNNNGVKYNKVFDEIRSKYLEKNNVETIGDLPKKEISKLFKELEEAWPYENDALAALEMKLMVRAELDEEDKAFWDSGMETYGPGSQSSEGVEADREYLIDKAENLISEYPLDLDEIEKVETLISDLQNEKYPEMDSGDELEKLIFDIENKYAEQDNEDKFDFTDVNSDEGQWAPEEIELTDSDIEELGTKLVSPEELKRILKDIKTLAPVDQQALENYLEAKTNG